MQKILFIEDDPEIVKLLNLYFDPEVYELSVCGDKAKAMEMIPESRYQLIILDISLPDGSGLEICREIRRHDKATPIMMLTSHSEEADKVLALELGADDYVTKPFGMLELLARVKAIIRRSKIQLQEAGISKKILVRDLEIDAEMRRVMLGGERIDLTVKEFDLLCLLAGNPGKTFSRRELLEDIWGYSFEGYEHTITSHINRLRLKLEKDLNNPAYILTAWGAGYRFAE
jgi:two-component system alkaline phosphatase synthesis response regulator PhoP